jgi:hypothetical protein
MKKLIFLSLFIIVSFTTKAQTLEQTMDYIESNLLNYANLKQFPTQCSENALQKTTSLLSDWSARRTFTQLFMKHIKSVSYSIDEGGYFIITVVGPCEKFEFDKLEVDVVNPSFISIDLVPSTPLENVNRIIKAIKHAATLEGAKLIDEDLFNN